VKESGAPQPVIPAKECVKESGTPQAVIPAKAGIQA
jgi:hypothetical protein